MRTLLLVNFSFRQQWQQPPVFLVAVLLLCLGVTGCAPKKDVGWSQDKKLILQSLNDMSQSEALAKSNMDLLNQRVSHLEDKLATQASTLTALQSTVRKQKMKQMQWAMKQEQQHQIQVAAQKGATARVHTPVVSTLKLKPVAIVAHKKMKTKVQQAPVVDSRDADLSKKSKEKDLYTAAYLSLKSGRYDEAIASFQDLLHQFPQGELVDQAYYWLGESFLSKGDFTHAIASFSSLVDGYPKSAKYQPALLRLAMAYKETHRASDAKALLQRLIQEYPDSRASEKARTRLAAMQGNDS